MRRHRSGTSDEAEVNMTPMLDIVFILLIFFIVTATFVDEDGMDLSPPPPADDNEPDKQVPTILIRVDEADMVTVNNKPVNTNFVRANIERLNATNPGSAVLIQAHRSATSKTVIGILDQAKLAGVVVSIVPDAEE